MIKNGSATPINQQTGSLPDVSAGMSDWFQPMVFEPVGKVVDGFLVVETGTPFAFRGVWQPLDGQQLLIKPEGQRAWSWFWLHSDTSLVLAPDDVVRYLGVQYRVMRQKPYDLYGYREYELVEDWTGAGPEVAP